MVNNPRLLLDSNVITDGLFSRFGLSKSILALCAAKTCRMVLSEWVRIEVERNILKKIGLVSEADAEELIDDYVAFLKLARPVTVPLAEESRVIANRSLIRHFADVPVVLAAIDSSPDWIITKNRDHFTNEVSKKIGIRIASPLEFFENLIGAL
jgi:predicted nucleic acid-binding protein